MEKQASASEPKRRRSRRDLLVGAAGALGVVGAEAIVKATPALAGTDGDVVLGGGNSTANSTTIGYSGSSSGFSVTAISASGPTAVEGDGGSGTGVQGHADQNGVYGFTGTTFTSSTGNGVHGKVLSELSGTGIGVLGEHAGTGIAVSGQSGGGVGVQATSGGSSAAAYATSLGGEGVYAQSGGTAGTDPGSTQHGVHGVTNASGYCGVFGEYVGNGAAAAVQGNNMSGKGQGVVGFGQTGLLGLALTGGTGVSASAAFDGTGLALNADGPAQFLLSGLATVAAGKSSVTVSGVSLRAGSLVLATVQNNAGVYVKFATPNVAKSKVTITLSKAVPSGMTANVAWFVVN